jgi:uncharacterized membrane protein
MRKCTKCGQVYDDTWKVCLTDGTVLCEAIDKDMVNSNPSQSIVKNKRSAGVTFFAWSFIALSILGLSSVSGMSQSYSFLSKWVLIWAMAYGFITSVVGIIVGINLLKLKEWSRRIAIGLIILGFLEMIFFVPLNHKFARTIGQEPNMIASLEKQYNDMPAENKAKIRVTKEEFVKKTNDFLTKGAIVITGIFEIITAIYLFLMFWFFIKPKVRKQFS